MAETRQIRRAVVFNAKTTTGIGEAIYVKGDTPNNWSPKDYIDTDGYDKWAVSISSSAGTDAIIKCIGAKFLGDTTVAPDLASVSDVGNEHSYIRMYELDGEDGKDGAVGVQMTGAETKLLMINAERLDLVNFEISAITAGAVTLSITMSK